MDDLKGKEALYGAHVDPNELMLEIKRGKYFMGRLQVSRFNIEEAVVKINGITNDLLVKGKNNLNRGLNMDTVAVEVLPANQWIEKGTRSEAIVTDILEKEEPEDVNKDSDSEDEEAEEKLNLVERINQSEKQPIARVVGIVQGKFIVWNRT